MADKKKDDYGKQLNELKKEIEKTNELVKKTNELVKEFMKGANEAKIEKQKVEAMLEKIQPGSIDSISG